MDALVDGNPNGFQFSLTVLLLYPDYVANSFGQETYLAHVKAVSVEEGVRKAQTMAFNANPECSMETDDITDFHPLFVGFGHIDDIKP